MKKIPLAPPADLGKLPQSELDRIAKEAHESIRAARERVENAAAAAARSEARTHAAAAAPSTNRGVKSEIAARLVLEDGKVMEVPARRTWGGTSAFLDWVNFTTDEVDFMFGMQLISDEEIIDRVSMKCKEIFGFGISEQRSTGANFYHRSYILGENCGMVCHGGQRSTVLVMLSGVGCEAAKEGWERRLYEFLTERCGSRAKLTRVDLAHDFYSGQLMGPVRPGELRRGYSVNQADADFDAGLFNCGGRNPNHEQRGNWKHPNGKGRTLYIGNRDSGKFTRIYEKGRQLGDKSSEWVRVEVEMKSINRIIPFEVLLEPGQYLAAQYPAFGFISEHQERILTTQKKTVITYDAMCAWLLKQCGAAINVLVEMEGTAEKAVAKIIKEGAIPSRLKLPRWDFMGDSIHEIPRPQLTREQFDALALA